MDPQNDWQEDGSCIRCGGYASITGNGPATHGVSISCEGDCGTYGATVDAEGDVVEYPPVPSTFVLNAPVAPDTFGNDPF